jgi:hypothetical protein
MEVEVELKGEKNLLEVHEGEGNKLTSMPHMLPLLSTLFFVLRLQFNP